MTTAPKNEYEAERAARIAANRARMTELGVLDASRTIANAANASASAKKRRRRHDGQLSARTDFKKETPPRRASRRTRGEEPENYDPNDATKELFEPTYAKEAYTSEQVAALGTRTREWTLFRDGYDERGNRIYDPVNGLCCHQCRQKTKGRRTSCSGCNMMRGVYCFDCLYMRQGEHGEEVAESGDAWRCPSCRDICNCSFCRTRKGFPPTGSMYRSALAMGFDSVAHYLVLSNQEDEAAREAAMKEAEIKAKEYAKKQAAIMEADREEGVPSPDTKPHWLKPKVIASE
jgi:hypothetical protein